VRRIRAGRQPARPVFVAGAVSARQRLPLIEDGRRADADAAATAAATDDVPPVRR
jgi:hypothetical protein